MWLITFLTIFFMTIILHQLFVNSVLIEDFTNNEKEYLEKRLSILENRVDKNEKLYSKTNYLQKSSKKNHEDIKSVLVNLNKKCHPLGYTVPECRPCQKDE